MLDRLMTLLASPRGGSQDGAGEAVGSLLQRAGSPPNMNILVTCSERGIAGAPEAFGLVLGSPMSARKV